MSWLITSLVFGLIQIGLWNVFPNWFRNWIFRIPLLAITANFLGSLIILKFAGSSAFIGSCNLTGSLIFAAYVLYHNERRKYAKKESFQV